MKKANGKSEARSGAKGRHSGEDSAEVIGYRAKIWGDRAGKMGKGRV